MEISLKRKFVTYAITIQYLGKTTNQSCLSIFVYAVVNEVVLIHMPFCIDLGGQMYTLQSNYVDEILFGVNEALKIINMFPWLMIVYYHDLLTVTALITRLRAILTF